MNKEIEIPEGYEARIEGNKVILELKESEDERIRSLLVWQVHRNIEDETNDLAGSVYDGIKGHDPDLEESIEDWKKCLAYLERQKEQKPNCKQNCVLTDEQLMATDFWKEYLKESIIPGNKPTKADIDFLLPIARKYFSLVMKEACTICKEWSNGYQKGLEAAEQKPAEWSEEDEKELDGIIRILDNLGFEEFCKSSRDQDVEEDRLYYKEIQCLKRLESLCDNYKKCNSRWKPSEEQINALQMVRDSHCFMYQKGRLAIETLLEQLKSLYYEQIY